MSPSLPSTDLSGHQISPELALVDSELAAAARLLLAHPALAEPVRQRQPAASAAPRARAQTPTAGSRLSAIAATGVAAIVAGALGLVPAAGYRAADATRAGTHAGPSELQAQATRQARAARTYRWSAVPGADTYEIKIVRGADVVFAATTRDLAVELPARLRLPPGRYTWSVTPTFGNQSTVVLRRPVVEATFQVVSS